MPWFEPSSNAPRYSAPHIANFTGSGDEERSGQQNTNRSNTNGNDEIISLHDYLDINWQFDTANDNAAETATQQQRRAEFNSFQHRVSHQLGSIFPSSLSASSAAALNAAHYHTDLHHHHRSHASSNFNLNGGRAMTNLSKTAQFFHPRRVMALSGYEGFFSPLDAGCADDNNDTNNNQGGDRQCDQSEARDIMKDGNDHHHRALQDTTATTSDEHDNNVHIRPRNLFLSSQPSNNNDHPNHHAAFQNQQSNDYSTLAQKRDKLPPSIQATLRQDPTTGHLATSLRGGDTTHIYNQNGTSSKASCWENYGGRPLMDGTNNDNHIREGQNENNKMKKKKKKDKSKGKSGKEKSGQRIDDMFLQPNNNRGNGGDETDDNAKKKQSKKTKKKKRSHVDSSCELLIPTNDVDNNDLTNSNTHSTTTMQPTLTEADFEGMTNTMNAAQCMEGLQQFLSRIGQEKYVAWTMIFLDPLCHYRQYTTDPSAAAVGGGNAKRRKRSKKFSLDSDNASITLECTTPFLPSNKRYCTEKGPKCTAWNCTCDDQIRAMRGGAPLLGAMFVLSKRDEDGGEEVVGEKECYLLPLGPTEKCLEDDGMTGYSRMMAWPVVPFDCEVSISDRWSAFEAIISSNHRKMVTYNATTALMPFYHHQFHDEQWTSDIGGESQASQIDTMLSSSQFTSCLTGTQDDNQNHFQRPAHLRSIWDLRLVSWMLRPDASDDQLEWSTFKSGFSHLVPDSTSAFYEGMPIVSRGLTEARMDLSLLHSLYPLINEQLIRQDLLRSLENIEAPVQSILTSMECRGVGFFPQRLKRVESQLSARINELEVRSRAITQNSEFMLSSPQQVSQFLFDTLKLKVPEDIVSKTKSSHRSTSEEALKAIKTDAIARSGAAPEILDVILEFRTLSKLLTTYIRPLPLLCVRSEGKSKKTPARIFPQWQMTAVRTGRLSCRKPNLQQLPSDAVFGVKPRDAFVPSAREGMCVFACDYSQKEVRILAHMSNDEALISLFRCDANTDIYKQMASLIRNKPAESITPEERAQFKQVTLALLYGMSPNQVAKKLSISKSAAQQTMNDFFRRFRRVKSWMEETKQMARRNGYVLTIAGRRRYLNDIRSQDNAKRSQAERQAINTVIQGSAADLMKTAMIQLSENLHSWQEESSSSEFTTTTRPQMVLQIHDEVLLELNFREGDIKKMQAIAVKSCCRDCEELFNLKVPLLLKCSCGLSFGSMKEI